MSNIAAGGELPSDPIFGNDCVAKKEDRLGVERVDNLPVSVGDGNGNAFSLAKLLEEENLAGKRHFLRKREQICRPFRFLSSDVDALSTVIPIVERLLVKEDVKVKLFQVPFQSIGILICGGNIGSSGLQTYIAAVVPRTRSCSIRAHSLKEKNLVEMEVYIPTSIVADRRAVYLSPYLLASYLPSKILSSLSNPERLIKF